MHNNIFKIGVKGLESVEADMLTPAGLENFSPSFDNTIEDWYSMENEGWRSSLLTGKGWSISFSGKRVIGDAANDYVARLMLAIGQDACTKFYWQLPDGLTVEQNVIVAVTNNGGGDTTNVGKLEFELRSDGAPKVTEPSSEENTAAEGDSQIQQTDTQEVTD